MSYFPQEIMTKILEYCDDRVEQRQRRLKGNVLDVIFRNSDISDDISGWVYDDDDNDGLTPDQLFEEYYLSFYNNDIIYKIKQREVDCNKVCKLLNIDKTNKTHTDIIGEAESKLGILIFDLDIGYYTILRHIKKNKNYQHLLNLYSYF